MKDPLFIIVVLAIAATVGALVIGIGSFAKGGKFNAKHSNKMMRLRILFQLIAVGAILAYIYLSRT